MPTSPRRSRSTLTSNKPAKKSRLRQNVRLGQEVLEVRSLMAADLPDGFAENTYAAGFDLPTAMEFAPDGRLFVLEKDGRVRVVKDGNVLATPFVTLVVNTEAENGLNGIAFDPNFENNGFLYLHYTYTRNDGVNANRISRFHASNFNADLVEPGSEVVMLDNIILPTGLHSTGTMHFGTDGMLYVSVGDRGATNEVQNLGTLAGKMLRLNVANYPNIIPQDNPFVNVPGARGEIFALGFRNPFSFAINEDTGEIMLNDVGSTFWEEVNYVTAGGNYGWPGAEGMDSNPNWIDPIHAYPHNGIGAGAITGGEFYTGNQFPTEYNGQYFFADFIYQTIRTIEIHHHGGEVEGHVSDFASGLWNPVDLDMGPDGSLYYLTVFGGEVKRISYVGDANRAPQAVATASPSAGNAPLSVFFSGTGSTDPDGDALQYFWDFGDGTTGTGSTVWHTYTTVGQYQARLTVNDGNGGTNTSAPLTISPGEHAPNATIQINAPHALYHGGDTINFSALATDQEDGVLPASAYKWSISFHHLDHVHPYMTQTGVSNGSFVVPTTGETSPDVWYRISLTVTDSAGLKRETFVDVHPQVVQVTIQSNVAGLGFELDGSVHTGSYTFNAVAGINRLVSAVLLQEQGDKTYTFQTWSDGGLQAHTFVTPGANSVLTVNYTALSGDRLSSSYFVAGLYEDVLRRKASAPELTAHVNNLVNGQPRANTINAIWNSNEARALLVTDAYNEVYGRLPNANELAAGITSINQTGSVHKLMSQLLGNPEYWSFAMPSDAGYIAGVYQTVLKRAVTAGESQGWQAQMAAGVSRTNMALAVLNSAERYALTISGYYQAFLNRPLDAFATSYWVGAIQTGGATLDSVAKAILGSAEYQTKMVARPVVRAMFDNVLHRNPTPAETTLMAGFVQNGVSREGIANAMYLAAERLYNLTQTAFTSLLGRAATTAELTAWNTAMSTGTSYSQMIANLVNTSEFATKTPTNAGLIQKLYPLVLNRSADSFGQNYWVGQLENGMTRENVVKALFGSTEYLNNMITWSYREYLGRTPGAAESNAWLSQIQSGKATVNSFNIALLASDEYWTKAQPRYMPTLTQQASNATYIASLYTELLQRTGSQGEINNWVSQVAQGMSLNTVVTAFWNSAEHRSVQAKELYQKHLHRAPTATELNSAVTSLAQGASLVDVSLSLMGSSEYSTQHASVASFVDSLYLEVLGRAADTFGRNAWIAAINGGMSRTDAIKSFQKTDEAWTKLVDSFYDDILGRDVDTLGASYWTGALKTGAKKLDDLGLALINSGEYYNAHD